MKKLLVVGALALVIISCVLVAGCTTVSTTDNGNQNAISGTLVIPLNGGNEGTSTTVMDEDGLIEVLGNKEMELTLGADIVLSEPIEIKKSIYIDLNGHSLKSKTYDNKIFTISSGYLVLKDSTSKNSSLLFMSGDSVYAVENGYSNKLYFVTVTDEDSLQEAVKEGGVIKLGSDIKVGSELEIDNKVTLDLAGHELNFKSSHHIYVPPEGDLTLIDSSNDSSGVITKCDSRGNGGGIYVRGGTLTINGGTITKCGAKDSGGGIYVKEGGKVTMNGGKITENKAKWHDGGGVYVDKNCTFIMTGGEISDNYAKFNGGGVCVNDSIFIMTGGKISENNSGDDGGGVCLLNSAEFTMSGAARIVKNITGDASSWDDGGGVYVSSKGTFTMEGGEISENLAQDDGGGVYVNDNGTFTMAGGSITLNVSNRDGGGVYVLWDGTFNWNGGEIRNNKGDDVFHQQR